MNDSVTFLVAYKLNAIYLPILSDLFFIHIDLPFFLFGFRLDSSASWVKAKARHAITIKVP